MPLKKSLCNVEKFKYLRRNVFAVDTLKAKLCIRRKKNTYLYLSEKKRYILYSQSVYSENLNFQGKGRRAEASSALKRLRGGFYDVNAELNQIQKEAEDNANRRSSVFDLVRLPAPRKALLICFAGMAFQQLSGINAVIFYTVNIFEAAGSSLDSAVAAILVSVVQVGKLSYLIRSTKFLRIPDDE